MEKKIYRYKNESELNEYEKEKYYNDMIEDINNNCGEELQLKIIVAELVNLISRLGVNFDSEEDTEDYDTIVECYNNLKDILIRHIEKQVEYEKKKLDVCSYGREELEHIVSLYNDLEYLRREI